MPQIWKPETPEYLQYSYNYCLKDLEEFLWYDDNEKSSHEKKIRFDLILCFNEQCNEIKYVSLYLFIFV